MDLVLLLSRLQFALTIMYHYFLPPLSIGLGAVMIIMESLLLCTGRPAVPQPDEILNSRLRRPSTFLQNKIGLSVAPQ
jgi:Cytochrome bd terminal oxidase subunit I